MPRSAPARTGTRLQASVTGVSQGTGSVAQAMLTATPRSPNWAAVKAAPTVPECRAERPAFMPLFTPDTIMSGRGPNPSMQAKMTAKAGGPSTP